MDPASALYDGTPLTGPDDLRQALLKRSGLLVQTFAENLMTYALGRRLELRRYDRGPQHGSAGRDGRLQDVGVRRRDRQEPGVPNEECGRTRRPRELAETSSAGLKSDAIAGDGDTRWRS